MPLPDDGTARADLQAYHSVPCGLFSTDRDGIIASVNDTLLSWLELPRAKVVGQLRFADLLTAGGRIYAETHLMPMLQVRGGFQEVALNLCAPGEVVRPVLASGQVTSPHEKKSAAATFALLPAEHRRSYEKELMRMRTAAQTRVNLLRQVEVMAGVGAWVLDVESQTLTWSDQVFHLHDLPVGPPPSPDAMLGFFKAADRELVAHHVHQAISTSQPFQFEAELITAKGRKIRIRAQGEAEREMGRVARVVGVVQDITEQHQIEQRLWRSAHVDELSGLSNRRWFRSTLAEKVDAGHEFALLLLDIDGFKSVNDTLGHQAGDALIRIVGQRLRAVCHRGEVLARLGGNEFAVVADAGPAATGEVMALAESIRAEIGLPFRDGSAQAQVSASIGIAFFPKDSVAADQLLRAADKALYKAKRSGRDQAILYRTPARTCEPGQGSQAAKPPDKL